MFIDLPKARELLRAAMETQGRDFVYNTTGGKADCFYRIANAGDPRIPEDDPRRKTACLVGTALTLGGWVRHVYGSARISNYESVVCTPDCCGGRAIERMTAEAMEYFQIAQDVQDPGGTWGQAYDKAEEYATRVLARAA